MSRQESIRWFPTVELSDREEKVCARCKRNGRLYVPTRQDPTQVDSELIERPRGPQRPRGGRSPRW